MTKVLLIIWISFTTVVSFILLYVAYRKAHPKPCDCCEHLLRKGGGILRYKCSICGSYDNQPQYCRNWKQRKDGDGNA